MGFPGDIVRVARGTLAKVTALNPVLQDGQEFFETDTRKSKHGDGVTPYNSLAYDASSSATGNSNAIPIGYSTVIPLDTNGPGKTMPETTLTLNSAFSVGPTVADGQCQVVLVGDGSHVPLLSAFTNGNSYVYSASAGARNLYIFGYTYGSPIYAGVLLPSSDITAPTLVSATVSDADATYIALVWSKPMNPTVSDASTFTVTGGHGLTSHTYDTPTTSHLVTGTPFIQTEATRTLSYTQPGTNKMQDLAASPNLVLSFTGKNIGNNVTNPQFAGASVSNSTPGRIDITWSDTISSTIPAVSTFAVSSGHPLTAHTYVDSTHTYLTTSTNFINGESAKTLSYTVPGTNPIKDLNVPANLGLGLTGGVITNNVVPSAPTFTAQSAPGGTNGTPYSYTFVATGATSYAVFSGTVPAGLALSSAGVLSGTPTTTAAYTFVVSATNTGGSTNSTSQSVTIAAAGAASMTLTKVTASDTDMTAAGYLDWVVSSGVGGGSSTDRKSGANLIGALTFTNMTDAGGPVGGLQTLSWTDGTNSATGNNAGAGHNYTSTTANAGVRRVFPAGTVQRKARVWLTKHYLTNTRIRATLTDGSFAEQTLLDTSAGDVKECFEVVYTATSTTTLTISVEPDSANSEPWVNMAGWSYGT